MTERKTVERLTRDILDADEYHACTQKSAKSIAARLVSMGWQPSIVHQCCEDAVKYRPREVSSVEEIAALPTGTICRTRDDEPVQVDHGPRGEWVDGQTMLRYLDGEWRLHLLDMPGDLDLTVLHTPEETP